MKLKTGPFAFACACLILFLPPSVEMVRAAELPASIATLRLQQGESFVRLRSRLIKSGWAPVHVHAGEGYEYDGTEKRLVERNFYEVDSCSTDRGSLCALYYKKGRTCLRVDTIGEQVDSMRVTRWEESCPVGEPKQLK
jgi:hypothetical protein